MDRRYWRNIAKRKKAITVFSLPWQEGVRERGITSSFTLTLTLSRQGRGKSRDESRPSDLKAKSKVSIVYWTSTVRELFASQLYTYLWRLCDAVQSYWEN